MDGEQRGGDAGWPAARPGRQAPQSPAPGADPGATQAYPGPLAGARSADPDATQAWSGPLAGSGASDRAATQIYGAPTEGAFGRAGAAATTTAPPSGPAAATQVFGAAAGTTAAGTTAAGAGAGRGAAPGTGGGYDTVAFQGPAAGGFPGAGRPGYDQRSGYAQPGYAQPGYDQQSGYAQPGHDQQTGYPGQPGAGGPGGYAQPGGFGPGGRPSPETGPSAGYPGGPSGPGRPGGTGGSGGPSRTLVLTSFGVAALLAVGVGTVWALNRPANTAAASAGPTQTIDTSPPSAPTTAPSASTSSPTPSDSPSTVTPSTVTPTTGIPAGAPTGYVQDPWARGMDFGTVLSVKKQGGGAVIQVKRQQFLTGDAAKQYYEQHPDKEPLDYAIVDVWEKHHFTVTDDCLIYGQSLLGDQRQLATVQLTVGQFVSKTKSLLGKSTPLRVWLYHKNGQNGPVVYIAEQYTP